MRYWSTISYKRLINNLSVSLARRLFQASDWNRFQKTVKRGEKMSHNVQAQPQVLQLAVGEINEPNRSALRRFWESWKRVARKIGDFQARLLLILFYFVILGPFALVVRWGSDPLAMKRGTSKGWQPREEKNEAPTERARRQF
jgi:hypothetical protein